jgi:hypothetical protein
MAWVSFLELLQNLLEGTPKCVPQQFDRWNPDGHGSLFFTTDTGRLRSFLIDGIVCPAAGILESPYVSPAGTCQAKRAAHECRYKGNNRPARHNRAPVGFPDGEDEIAVFRINR